MLINRTGINIFSDVDLTVAINESINKLNAEVRLDIKSSPIQDRERYIEMKKAKYFIKPIIFQADLITATTREEMISAAFQRV